MDETWVHYHTPEFNRQSAEWLKSHESRSKRPKDQRLAGKVMASVFWNAHGIIFIDYLQKGRTVTGEYYAALLDKLNDKIKKKRPHMARRKKFCTITITQAILESDGQIGPITIRIGCSPTVFSRLGPQRLLSVPKPQAVAPGKEIHIE